MLKRKTSATHSYSTVESQPGDIRFDNDYITEHSESVLDGNYFPYEDALDKRRVRVDYSENPQVYLSFLDDAVIAATSERDFVTINKFTLVKEVTKTLQRRMKLADTTKTRFDSSWRESWGETANLNAVNLSELMIDGKADEHHFSLANVALLQMLIRHGVIAGDAHLQTSTRLNMKNMEDREVYTYAIYTDPNGEEFVSDSARGVFGKVKDMKETGRDYGQRKATERNLGIVSIRDHEQPSQDNGKVSA